MGSEHRGHRQAVTAAPSLDRSPSYETPYSKSLGKLLLSSELPLAGL